MTLSVQEKSISNAKRWLVAGLLACGLMLLTHLLCGVTYLNNDDTNIMYALAGYRTGTPYPTHRFINVLLGLAVSGLYRLLPGLPWWTVYQLCAVLLSLTVIFACLIKLLLARGLPLWQGILASTALYCTVFIYPVLTMSFTLTAGMLGTAGAMLLLCRQPEEKGVKAALGSLLLLALCFLTRNSAGLSMLCFWGAAVFYRLLLVGKEKKALFQTLALALAGGLTALCCILVNNWGVAAMNPGDYPAFEAARGKFTDYPHIAYADDPAFFRELGWDKSVYDLADNLCFLDEAITADTMNAVVNAPLPDQPGLGARLIQTLRGGVLFFRGSGIAQYMVVIPAVLLLLLAAFYVSGRRRGLRGRGRGQAAVSGLCVALGAAALCGYLLFTGRFPVRTFQLIALPATALLAALCAGLYLRPDLNKGRDLLLLALTACVLSWSLAKTGDVALRYDKSDLMAVNSEAEAYCMAHPDNVYITDVTSLENIAAFTAYPDAKPVNLVDWGGTAMGSGWKEAQLALNGLTPFTGAVFRKDNVYFLTREDGEKLHLLNAYLTAHEGATGYTYVDTAAADIAVYRFQFSEDAS